MLLMILIWGSRHYGRVHSAAGQYAVTRFGHLWFLPLLPIESLWVVREEGDSLRGHTIPMSPHSVAAGYLRVWGPVAVVAGVIVGGVAGVVAALAGVGLTAWSWTWWRPRAPREQRRAQWHREAFGTACDPLRMESGLAAALRAEVEARFAAISTGRTPADVARLGATTDEQAVTAYALLRLTAALGGAGAREARAAGERILDAQRDEDAGLVGGPYRSVTA